MGAVNYLTTILRMRAPGMSMFRMPLTVWALFITSILQLLATPVLGSAMILLVLERVAKTAVFTPDTVVRRIERAVGYAIFFETYSRATGSSSARCVHG